MEGNLVRTRRNTKRIIGTTKMQIEKMDKGKTPCEEGH